MLCSRLLRLFRDPSGRHGLYTGTWRADLLRLPIAALLFWGAFAFAHKAFPLTRTSFAWNAVVVMAASIIVDRAFVVVHNLRTSDSQP